MIKKNKLKVIISSAIILLPMLFGLIMWNDLPGVMTTHFGADGTADGLSGKAFAVFGIPAILFAFNIICLLVTEFDKKQKEQNPKALGIIFWIIPIISLLVNGIMYCTALGKEVNLAVLTPALIGVMFIFIGNYMPKIKHNRTLGIKVYWTLCNEENWNKTHRLGGKIMVTGGFIMLLCVVLPLQASIAVLICVLAVTATVPAIYSYLIYKKHQKEGVSYMAAPKSKAEKAIGKISAVVLPVILIGLAVIMFTGNIEVSCQNSTIKINTAYWADTELAYSDIDTVDYRKELDIGARTSGFSSARLAMGIFQNEEFGAYTLYSYTGAKEFVVLTAKGKTLVIGLRDAKSTQAFYAALLENLSAQINN